MIVACLSRGPHVLSRTQVSNRSGLSRILILWLLLLPDFSKRAFFVYVVEAHLRVIVFHFCVDIFIQVCIKVLIKSNPLNIGPNDVDSPAVIRLPRNKSLLRNKSIAHTVFCPFKLSAV